MKNTQARLRKDISQGHAPFLILQKTHSIKKRRMSLSKQFLEAVSQGQTARARDLLDQGAYIDAKNFYKNTALHLATMRRDYSSIEFFADPSTINLSNAFGDTALSLAVHQKDYNGAELLLKKGADHRVINATGKSLLRMAVEQGLVGMVELLLKYGADPNYTGFNAQPISALFAPLYRSPLYLARFNPRISVASSKKIVSSLLLNGADIAALPIDEVIQDYRQATHVPREVIDTYMLYLIHGWNPWSSNPYWMHHLPKSYKGEIEKGVNNLYDSLTSIEALRPLLELDSPMLSVGRWHRYLLSEVLRWMGYAQHNRSHFFVSSTIQYSDDLGQLKSTWLDRSMFAPLEDEFQLANSSLRHFSKNRLNYQWCSGKELQPERVGVAFVFATPGINS